ncbi:MAG: CAP domain-containing protein [bacterium]|nr:CAP domain-containing protein [bacterium]
MKRLKEKKFLILFMIGACIMTGSILVRKSPVMAAAVSVKKDSPTIPTLSVKGTINYDYINNVLKLVNKERKEKGLKALTLDTSLTHSAIQRSYEIAMYFSHTRPNGQSCFTAIETPWSAVGENIAAGYSTPEKVVNGWMNSPGHRANMLNETYNAIGIGAVEIEGCYYWVQIFMSGTAAPFSKKGKVSSVNKVETLPSLLSLSINYNDSMVIGQSQTLQLCNNGIKVALEDATVTSSNNVLTVRKNRITAERKGKSELLFTANSLGMRNKKVGTITVKGKNIASCSIKLSHTTYTYDGKVKKPSITVISGKTKLKNGTDYSVTYKSNKEVGTATVEVNGKGNYTGIIKKTFKIGLQKPTIKVTAGKKKITVEWRTCKGASGYQLYRSTKKDKSYKCIKTIKGGSTIRFVDHGVKAKKIYYYKVRAYRTVKGKKVYSSYSTVVKNNRPIK